MLQFFQSPDPSDRIVRIAQQQDFCFRIGSFPFKIGKVDYVAAILINEIIGKQLASVITDR